jgi:phosphatidate cytidylyltransferase
VLRWRLLSAILIIAPLLGLMVADFSLNFGVPGLWLVPLALLITAMAVAEVLDLLLSQNLRPASWSVHAGAQLVVIAGMVPLLWNLSGSPYPDDSAIGRLGWPFLALPAAMALIFLAEMQRFRQPGQSVIHVALGTMTVVYLAVPVTFLTALRIHHDNRWGMVALVSLIFVVKMSDAGAYFSGRWFGRSKLAPLISPKKTRAGFVGGLLTAACASWLFFQAIAPGIVEAEAPQTSFPGTLLYGVLIGAAGVVGDLSESLLKRDMQRKESGTSLPGLGGILDVLDSLLFAAPVAYLCWVFCLVEAGSG